MVKKKIITATDFFAGWHYRILVNTDKMGIEWFEVHHVQYKNDMPVNYAKIAIPGFSPETVKSTLQMMLKDTENAPILWGGDKFPQKYVGKPNALDSEYFKKIDALNKSIKAKPLQFKHTAEEIRELNRERDKRLIELANEPEAIEYLNEEEKSQFLKRLKKANKSNIHKEIDTGKHVGNEEW